MRIKFLGTGSAFTLKNYQSNMAIEHNGKWLLLDAGGDIRFSLKDAGLSYNDIDAIYISHLHGDHAGGLETIAFCKYFDPKAKKATLYGSLELLRQGWENTWKGGLESIQGKILSLEDFFLVNYIGKNESFFWEDIKFTPVQSVHIVNGFCIVPCYGLMFEYNDKTIYWTADTQFCPHSIMDFYKSSNLIIQDCETSPFKSGVHANFLDLETLPDDIKKKMILTHYQDNVVEDSGDITLIWSDKVKEAGFDLGFAVKGQELDLDTFFSRMARND